MIATFSLLLFILLYGCVFLFHPPIALITIFLLLTACILIVLKVDKAILFILIIAMGILFIPYQIEIERKHSSFMYGDIISISGSVLFDSTLSENGNSVVRLKVEEMKSMKGVSFRVNRTIITIIRGQHPLYEGSKVTLYGHFFIAEDSSLLFMSNSSKIISKHIFIELREKIIEKAKSRVELMSEKNQHLVLLLTLGIKQHGAKNITHLAVHKGVAHLFALSGMHLSVLLSLFSFIFSKLFNMRKSQILTLIIALCYVFIAGNKPSLVRSILSLIITLLPWIHSKIDSFLCVIILNMLIFPSSMMTLAAVYSYTAMFGIIVSTQLFTSLLAPYLPSHIASSSALSLSAMGITAIVSLVMFNTFTHLGFLYTHLLTPVIMLLLVVSIIYFLIPFHGIGAVVEWLSDSIYTVLEGATLHNFNVPPLILYLLFLLFSLTLFLLLCYSQKQKQSRSRASYEMDISLRIKFPDKNTP